ncbi:MAG: hypothetical protein KatS3mg004_2790 [Bryobacteraceae bacterium]|nr:MAG: hypothetical protein KatS3mg004_2790 [Bryobacteraceae bacterium]
MKRFLPGFLAAILLTMAAQGQAPPVYTIDNAAGNGAAGFAGDSGKAQDAQINFPLGLAIDKSGNVYIADQFNHRIRRIAPDGTITTVAGSGTQGSAGDDGPATSAQLNYPSGIAIDGSGALYITDTMNHVIRKVAVGGNITRIAGQRGLPGFVEKNAKGEFIDAKDAQLNAPTGIAIDSAGNIYFCDTRNHRVRKIGTDGKIQTIAGTGEKGETGDGGSALEAKLNSPTGVAVDAAGNVYIADQMNHRIRKVDTSGIITTVAGTGLPGYSGNGGLATKAQLFYPCCIALDAQGNLFIADRTNNRVRRVDAAAGTISLAAGTGRFGDDFDGRPADQARLRFPMGLAADPQGRIYFSDNANSRVKLLTPVAQGPAGELAEPPAIRADGGIAGDPSFGAPLAAAPGSWIEIYGSNLAPAEREWTSEDFQDGRAPTTLVGTTVWINGQAAPLAYVSPSMLRVQVPLEIDSSRATVVVETVAGRSAPRTVAISAAAAGVLAPVKLRIEGKQFAAAQIAEDGAYALPENASSEFASRPARAGETLVLHAIGLGAVTPQVATGEVAPERTQLAAPLEVRIGGMPADVLSAGLAPGKVGLYQIRVRVPALPQDGAAPLEVLLNGKPIPQELYVAVAQP